MICSVLGLEIMFLKLTHIKLLLSVVVFIYLLANASNDIVPGIDGIDLPFYNTPHRCEKSGGIYSQYIKQGICWCGIIPVDLPNTFSFVGCGGYYILQLLGVGLLALGLIVYRRKKRIKIKSSIKSLINPR